MFSLIYAWMHGWVNNREAGDFRRHRAHYDVIVMMNCSMPAADDDREISVIIHLNTMNCILMIMFLDVKKTPVL